MERIQLQNEKIKEKRQVRHDSMKLRRKPDLTILKEVINDEEEFNKISADDIDVRQRKERQARLQAEVDRERQKVAQKKLAQLQNRAWDAGKKGPAEQGSAPPRTDKAPFWGPPKVETNGDIRPGRHGPVEWTAYRPLLQVPRARLKVLPRWNPPRPVALSVDAEGVAVSVAEGVADVKEDVAAVEGGLLGHQALFVPPLALKPRPTYWLLSLRKIHQRVVKVIPNQPTW
jgi:hypothetical protein